MSWSCSSSPAEVWRPLLEHTHEIWVLPAGGLRHLLCPVPRPPRRYSAEVFCILTHPQTCSFSSPFLLHFLLSWCFRIRPDQPRVRVCVCVLILSSASVVIVVSSLFAGPCGTPRRQRVIGTVCLSNYTQILWGGDNHINCVSTSDFMKAGLIGLFLPKDGRVTEWLTLQQGLHLCITSYLSAIFGCEKRSWSRLLAGWQLSLTYQYNPTKKEWVTCLTLHSKKKYFKAHNSRHTAMPYGKASKV